MKTLEQLKQELINKKQGSVEVILKSGREINAREMKALMSLVESGLVEITNEYATRAEPNYSTGFKGSRNVIKSYRVK